MRPVAFEVAAAKSQAAPTPKARGEKTHGGQPAGRAVAMRRAQRHPTTIGTHEWITARIGPFQYKPSPVSADHGRYVGVGRTWPCGAIGRALPGRRCGRRRSAPIRKELFVPAHLRSDGPVLEGLGEGGTAAIEQRHPAGAFTVRGRSGAAVQHRCSRRGRIAPAHPAAAVFVRH